MDLTRHQEELLERAVKAFEKLVEEPEIQFQVETHPPVCPHCETINPMVHVRETEAMGKLAEFIVSARCRKCDNQFYGIPFHWACVKTPDEAKEIISEKVELGGYQREDSSEAT